MAEGELTPDGSASYEGAVIKGETPDVQNLKAAFKNSSGQTVEVELAFDNPSTSLTATGNVSFTATAKTANSYAVYNGTVNIKVKEAAPEAGDVSLITENLDQVAAGKTAFASAYANMQYSVDGESWNDITTTPFDVPESKKIYVHKTGSGTDPSDSLEITVTDANIGTKKAALAAVSITTPKLISDQDTIKITGTITDSNAAGSVTNYTVSVYETDTLIASGTADSKDLADVALTMEDGQTFSLATSYTVRAVANPADTAKNEASEAGTGAAATNQCIVTVDLQGETGVAGQRVDYNGSISETPTKDGYTFEGWFDAASDGNKVTAITENTTVYAQWTEDATE